jgi:hypothetical protein
MPIVLDGTNGINTPDLESAGPISGTTGTFSGAVQASGVAANLYPLVSATAVSASGTAVDFTGIPSWVRRITVMFDGLSVSGTSIIQTQLGTSGGVQTSGYNGMYLGGAQSGALQSISLATGIPTGMYQTAPSLHYGQIIISLLNSATGAWTYSGASTSPAGTPVAYFTGGSKALSGTLDRVRITTVNGTDTFDAGSINIMYE